MLNFLEKEIKEWIKKVKQMKGINEFNDEYKGKIFKNFFWIIIFI